MNKPRVMTADEVKDLQTLNVVCWLWLEEKQHVTWNVHHIRAFVHSKHPDNGEFYIMANCYHEIIRLEGNDYGKTWRIWTECPAYEQRGAVPWD